MQKIKSIKIIFIILIFIINSTSFVFAKSGPKHAEDMFAILGLDFYSYQNYLVKDDLCKTINENIDDVRYTLKNFRVTLQNKYWFSYDLKYTHRLICHWSFDIDEKLTSEMIPDSSQYPRALKDRFDFISEKWTPAKPDKLWHELLKYISNSQTKRNDKMIKAVKNTLGIKGSYSRDIAAILYSVHLLGDHIVHAGEDNSEVVLAVLEMDKIVNCINEHIRNIAVHFNSVRGRNCMDEYYRYETSLKKCNKSNDKKYAESVLLTLKTHLPNIIFFQFGNKMSSKGLIFVEADAQEALAA